MICRMRYFIYHRQSSTAREILEVGTVILPLLLACMFSFILGIFASGPIFKKKMIPLAYTNYLFVMPKEVSSA